MNERGYPTEDSSQIIADLSVEHATTLDNYRMAQAISQNAAAASTEELRQAMVHYRALFSDLLGRPDEAQTAADTGNPAAARVPAAEPGDPMNPGGEAGL